MPYNGNMTTEDRVLYFGYGANRDASMMAAILDRPASELVGHPLVLDNYALVVQRLDQIPESASTILRGSWDDDFVSYAAVRQEGSKLSGIAWELTQDELDRMNDWELTEFGWFSVNREAVTGPAGNSIEIVIQEIIDQPYDHIVDGATYDTWAISKDRLLAQAERARQEYDERFRDLETKNFS